MDVLTHIFLPLAALYVIKRELFNPRLHFLLALFALAPDLDKLVGMPGLLHSLVTLAPLIFAILLFELYARGSVVYSKVVAFFISSHLALDVLDAGVVPFFYPFIKVGIGLKFPIKVVFHNYSFSLLDAPVQVLYAEPKIGFFTYDLISGFGVASLILFTLIYFWMEK